jgi:putative ABC transport system ATP-binding protein
MTSSPAVRLESVSRVYDTAVPVGALQGVSFEIARGELVAIVGVSGSGKSTLLNILGLLDQPTSGHYLHQGTDVSRLSDAECAARRALHVGFVFQSFHLLPYRSALDNVAIAAMYAGVPRRDRHALAAKLLASVGVAHRATFLPPMLSGGEQQRVAVARALAGSPDLLLCDEPTGNLDSHNRDIVLDLLGEVNARGITTVIVTHDEQVAAFARRQIRLRDGRLVSDE